MSKDPWGRAARTRVHEYLGEVLDSDQLTCHFPLGLERADECGHHNQACIHHEFGHLGHAAYVLHPVGIGKAQVSVQPLSDVVAIQYVGALSLGMKFLFQRICNG